MVKDISLIQKGAQRAFPHCRGSYIEIIKLNNLLSVYSEHVGSRSTDAHRGLMEKDSMVNDIFFIQKDARRAIPLCRWG